MKRPLFLTSYIADLRDSTGRRRALLIAGGLVITAMTSWDLYMVASGAVPLYFALMALPIARSTGRAAADAYRRHHLKH